MARHRANQFRIADRDIHQASNSGPHDWSGRWAGRCCWRPSRWLNPIHVHWLSVWTRSDRPTDGQTIKAVDRGRQMHLANPDFKSVSSMSHCSFGPAARKSQLMRFSGAGMISSKQESHRCRNDQAPLRHQTLYDLLRDEDVLPAPRRLYPAVAVAVVIEFEDLGNRPTRSNMLLHDLEPAPMTKVRAQKLPRNNTSSINCVQFKHPANRPDTGPTRQNKATGAVPSRCARMTKSRMGAHHARLRPDVPRWGDCVIDARPKRRRHAARKIKRFQDACSGTMSCLAGHSAWRQNARQLRLSAALPRDSCHALG